MTLPISFEFFPPKTPEGVDKLRGVRRQLYALRPEFCSMTYGAGGSTQAGTFAAVAEMLAEGVDAASHFSCIGATRASVRSQLAELRDMGVTRLVALRGDLPSGYGAGGEFQYASELIEFIRAETGSHFRIYAACYPEVHPQARSPQADLQALAAKVRAGADVLVTQMFFNADAYFHFVDEVHALGLQVPVVPGIMPITNSAGLLRFADNCGAEVPRWMRLRLQGFGDDVAVIRAFGAEVMARLCERLVAGGAPSLHFYTLNQAAPTLALCARLGLGA
ncbi:MAG TPA: methylenetetrahydrofolate reductase [NAD(P)H] [Ottowia sp.]|uniref:methylenetetrahydrofolate reductase [NAD(P)H] n=1 Tax=Ottowia sp. TaxID=1898956 RepID=UPI002C214C4E|nr:methylenetetrahydrofolate reductase [NAD(P)H] [Ottowia sp.]HMN20058.1 methylenetetrahydrofolate reductase [NAD(P)H] [Ottowia sp.]